MVSPSQASTRVWSFGWDRKNKYGHWTFSKLSDLFTDGNLRGNLTCHIGLIYLIYNSNFVIGIGLIEHLQGLGVLPAAKDCPKCKQPFRLWQETNEADGCRWVCRQKDNKSGWKCKVELSVRSGTIFENSKLAIPEIVSHV